MPYRSLSAVLMPCGTAIATAMVAPTAHAQSEPQHHYALPAQSLGASLQAVAQQSGQTVLARSSVVAGISAPALDGTFSPEEALHKLLEGSGLVADRIEGGFVVRWADTPGTAAPDQPLDILVTGSRLRGARIASPMVRIGAQDIADSGLAGIGDVVRRIPQSFGGGQNPGIGMNVPAASGVDIGGSSSVNLRGLGSDATLTLFNGHRLSYTAVKQSVDVSAIPASAVERIDVVPDGASAIYGSDAVAGVANVILRRDYDGIETRARLAAATSGGDFEQQYGVLAGHTWQSGGVFAAYEFGSNTAIHASQRDYAASRSPGLDLFPALSHHSLVASGHQALGDALTLEVSGLYNIRWSDLTFPTVTGGDLNLGRASLTSTDRSFGIAPSLALALPGSWQVTLGGTYGKERVDYRQVQCTKGVCNNPGLSFYRNTAGSVELTANGDLIRLPAGSAKLALGGGYRDIAFERFVTAGSPVNTAHSQSNSFAFAELSLPVIGEDQGRRFANRLDLSAAVRYERYPGIGSVLTPKLGMVWALTSDVSIKGSWGKSFRAPTLYQQYQPRAVYLFPPAALGATGVPATASALLILGGNPALKPERATTWSATLAVHPRQLAGASLEISYFDVHYRDRIVAPITLVTQALSNPVYRNQLVLSPSVAAQAAVIASAGTFLNVTGTPYDPANVIAIVDDANVNAGRQHAHGIDLLASYRADLGQQRQLRVSFDLAWLDSDQQLSALQPIVALAGTIFNPPHWRGQAAMAWSTPSVTLSANLNYTGGVEDMRSPLPAAVGAMTTLDLTGRYRLPTAAGALAGTELFVSVQNLLDAHPDTIATSLPYDTPYDSTNYSPVGRLVAVGITRKW